MSIFECCKDGRTTAEEVNYVGIRAIGQTVRCAIREVGRTIRCAITGKHRTGRLCALLVVGALACTIIFVTLIGVRAVAEEIVNDRTAVTQV